jgi:predicted nucleic acid-binding protein
VNFYFDTSAFVKRYVEEPGTADVAFLCAQASRLTLSVLCFPEMVSTLTRLVREGVLAPTDYSELKRRILDDLADTELITLTPAVIDAAVRCLEQSPLRALDALHVGCALVACPDRFVSADGRQIDAAQAVGLDVIDLRE